MFNVTNFFINKKLYLITCNLGIIIKLINIYNQIYLSFKMNSKKKKEYKMTKFF